MTIKSKIAAVLAVGTLTVAGQANAYQFDFGSFSTNFNLIDWSAGGSAWVNGFSGVVGSTFTLNYLSNATALLNNGTQTAGLGGGNVINFNPLSATAGELTIFATITERITNVYLNGSNQVVAEFAVDHGNWDVYFDTAANSSLSTGLGFTDGVRVLGGGFDAGVTGLFTNLFGSPGTLNANGTGSNYLSGTVNYVDPAYVSPSPNSTNATTTLQYGTSALGWTRPSGFENLPGYNPTTDNFTSFVLQADANQNFVNKVPEPATMVLAGLGLLGLSVVRRRTK